MKLYNLVKQEDGSVKVESVLTDEEMLFMLEFALMNLVHMGLVPASIAKYAEENQNEVELEYLKNADKDKMGNA